jgi:putative transposase
MQVVNSKMAVRFQQQSDISSLYFITFTCYKWLPLFQISNAYDSVYKWFDHLHKINIHVTAYVIMPNHIHVMLYVPHMSKRLNIIVGNGKRFMAYEIIKRLDLQGQLKQLDMLYSAVNLRERKKGQIHRVFEESFDAKQCYNHYFIYQKLEYIHNNPVRKKWNLVSDYTTYEYSSASFYEKGISKYENILHINDILL